MLGEESPLDILPERLPAKQVLFLDAIATSIRIIDQAYMELQGSIVEEANTHRDGARMIYRAWSVVDSVNRLRLLVDAMPGLKKSSPPVQLFLRRVGPVEDLRNVIQHLNTEVHNILERGGPVWGVLTWRKPNPENANQILLGFYFHGHMGGEMASPASVTVSNTPIELPVDRIELTAAQHRVSLSDLRNAVRDLAQRLEAAAAKAWADLPAGDAEEQVVVLVPEL